MNEPPDIDTLARRMDAEQKAAAAMTRARTQLVLGDMVSTGRGTPRRAQTPRSVFFATLAMRLDLRAEWSIPTAATDGKRLLYNPEFWCGLNGEEHIGVVAHEVLHAALGHVSRIAGGKWNRTKANCSCDLAINQILKDAGFKLPSCGLFPGQRPKGDNFPEPWSDAIAAMQPSPVLAWEQYYNMLPDLPPGCGGGDGDDPGGCGGVEPAPDEATAEAIEADWQIAVAQAAEAASKRGTMPAGLEKFIQEVLDPKVDWRDALRQFVHLHAKTEYSWAPPNRRLLSYGMYLPAIGGESLAPGVIAIDASGSCWSDDIQRQFAGEVQAIAEQFGSALTVLYHDTAVHKVVQWSPMDGELRLDAPSGGGGTSHVAVWDWIAEQDTQPEWCIALTDLDTDHGSDPGFPVLWAVLGGNKSTPPFGQRVEIE